MGSSSGGSTGVLERVYVSSCGVCGVLQRFYTDSVAVGVLLGALHSCYEDSIRALWRLVL